MEQGGEQSEDDAILLAPSRSTWTREQVVLIAFNGYYIFLWSTFNTMMVPLLPHYMKDLDGSILGHGMVLGAVQVGWLLAFPFLQLAPISPRSMLNLGMQFFILAAGIILASPSVPTLILGRTAEGFGNAILSGLLTGTLAREIPADALGQAVALRNAFGCLGMCLGPALGGILYPLGGIRLPMSIVLGFAIILPAMFQLVPSKCLAALEEGGSGRSAGIDCRPLLKKPEVMRLLTVSSVCLLPTSFSYLAVPKLLHDDFHLSAFMTMMVWLVWDLARTCSSLAGGAIDASKPWLALGIALQLLCYTLAALTLEYAATATVFKYMYFALWGVVFSIGGLIGPSFFKAFAATEHGEQVGRYVELMVLRDFVTTVTLLLGPMLTAVLLPILGFRCCLISLAAFCISSVILLAMPASNRGPAAEATDA